MTAKTKFKRKKILMRTLIYGAITTALYAAVFSNASPITELFAKGGYYAALPIATVFIFSFAHGAFSSNLWSVVGIEAITKQATTRKTSPTPRPIQKPRARLRMSV
ncbi:MAG: hypothetical protein ACP5VS_11565 [Desulfomonilaceae bacterium]